MIYARCDLCSVECGAEQTKLVKLVLHVGATNLSESVDACVSCARGISEIKSLSEILRSLIVSVGKSPGMPAKLPPMTSPLPGTKPPSVKPMDPKAVAEVSNDREGKK